MTINRERGERPSRMQGLGAISTEYHNIKYLLSRFIDSYLTDFKNKVLYLTYVYFRQKKCCKTHVGILVGTCLNLRGLLQNAPERLYIKQSEITSFLT